jgi:hypothetical protein
MQVGQAGQDRTRRTEDSGKNMQDKAGRTERAGEDAEDRTRRTGLHKNEGAWL